MSETPVRRIAISSTTDRRKASIRWQASRSRGGNMRSRCDPRFASRSRAAPGYEAIGPVDQSEAAERFIAAPEHEEMHDERLWDLRQKREREMHGIPEWEELRDLASAHQGTYALSSGRLSRTSSRRRRRANGVEVPLGARRRRAQSRLCTDILRESRRERPRQEQVDADGGVRACAPYHGEHAASR